MDTKNAKTADVQKMDVEEITIGNTTFIVKSNAPSVPKAFVKKTVEKLLFSELKQKS